MTRCLSAPDATSLPQVSSSILYYLMLNSALDIKRPVTSLVKGGLLGICHLLSIHQVQGRSKHTESGQARKWVWLFQEVGVVMQGSGCD